MIGCLATTDRSFERYRSNTIIDTEERQGEDRLESDSSSARAMLKVDLNIERSEERRVGKEC